MPRIIEPGESIAAIASDIFNGDVLRFTELLDENPNFDVFSDLVQGITIDLPDTSQILNIAKPVLSEIGETIASATGTIEAIASKLPSNLQGYAKDAVKLLGEVNGVVGEAESTLTKVGDQVREYDGEPVKLVQWLLGGQV